MAVFRSFCEVWQIVQSDPPTFVSTILGRLIVFEPVLSRRPRVKNSTGAVKHASFSAAALSSRPHAVARSSVAETLGPGRTPPEGSRRPGGDDRAGLFLLFLFIL